MWRQPVVLNFHVCGSGFYYATTSATKRSIKVGTDSQEARRLKIFGLSQIAGKAKVAAIPLSFLLSGLVSLPSHQWVKNENPNKSAI